MDALIVVAAVLAVSVALLLDRYFAWREWDAERRRRRAWERTLKRTSANLRLLSLTFGLEFIPAARKMTAAINACGAALTPAPGQRGSK